MTTSAKSPPSSASTSRPVVLSAAEARGRSNEGGTGTRGPDNPVLIRLPESQGGGPTPVEIARARARLAAYLRQLAGWIESGQTETDPYAIAFCLIGPRRAEAAWIGGKAAGRRRLLRAAGLLCRVVSTGRGKAAATEVFDDGQGS